MGGDGTDSGPFDIRQAGCVIEAPRKVCLDELPLCVVPGREAFSDTSRTITESDVACFSTSIAKLSKAPVFLGFQKCHPGRGSFLIHCNTSSIWVWLVARLVQQGVEVVPRILPPGVARRPRDVPSS